MSMDQPGLCVPLLNLVAVGYSGSESSVIGYAGSLSLCCRYGRTCAQQDIFERVISTKAGRAYIRYCDEGSGWRMSDSWNVTH